MNKKSFTLSGQRGFSLVELLVVIAVIAIIAAIAIPNIANITQQAEIAKNQRNAQNIASVATSAIAAGYTNTTTWTDVAGVVDEIISGTVQVTKGGNTMTFKVSALNDADQTGVTRYLQVTGATTTSAPIIDYIANPSDPADPADPDDGGSN